VDVQSTLHGSEKAWKPHRSKNSTERDAMKLTTFLVTQTVEEAADAEYDFVIGCFKYVDSCHFRENRQQVERKYPLSLSDSDS
jgi:hypothetical protein